MIMRVMTMTMADGNDNDNGNDNGNDHDTGWFPAEVFLQFHGNYRVSNSFFKYALYSYYEYKWKKSIPTLKVRFWD